MWTQRRIGGGVAVVACLTACGEAQVATRQGRGAPEPPHPVLSASVEPATAPSPPPAPAVAPGPVLTPAILERRASAQARMLGRGAEIVDARGVVRRTAGPAENGNALGVFVPVENESALGAFHAALRKLERGQLPGGKLRILAYGASHTQADIYTGYLRHYLQSRFGDGGAGFLQLASTLASYRTSDLKVSHGGFTIQYARHNAARASGWFGLLGAAGVGRPGASAAVETATKRLEGPLRLDVYSMGHADGGELTLFVDGKPELSWSTRADPARPLVSSFVAEDGLSSATVKATGNGAVRLFGVVIERASPGVVIDTLGISGTRAADWLRWDEAAWARQVASRDPQLVTMAYGTNETSDDGQPIERYERDLDQVLTRLRRAAPQASCLLIGPGDVSRNVGGVWVRRARVARIIEVERRQALAHGCGFWDTFAFMGAAGIERWVAASPKMARSDRIHLTRRGYVKLGMMLGDALLRAYDAGLATAGDRPDAGSDAGP